MEKRRSVEMAKPRAPTAATLFDFRSRGGTCITITCIAAPSTLNFKVLEHSEVVLSPTQIWLPLPPAAIRFVNCAKKITEKFGNHV